MTLRILLVCMCFGLLASCATTGKLISSKAEVDQLPENSQIDTRFFILGNSIQKKDKKDVVLQHIQQQSTVQPVESEHVLFMGDDSKGKKKHPEKVTQQLDSYISFIKNTKAKPYFIPGNYEWDFNGTAGLEIIENYLEDNLEHEDPLTPNNGCPLESIEVNDKIHLLIIDTQWYIENWYLHPSMNDKCEIKTREKLLLEIEGEIKKYANKVIVVAMHHPMYTNGFHGGRFSIRDHLFPLQGNVPLPGIGSLVAQVRSQGAISIQDRYNKRYNELMNELKPLLNLSDQRIILVSGHEENLQYIEEDHIKQIVSGAGSKSKPVSIGKNGLFSYGKKGYTTLDFTSDGSVWASFYGAAADTVAPLLFQKKIFSAPAPPHIDPLPATYPKEVSASVYDLEKVEKSDFFTSFWGDHYRNVYGVKVKAPVALLDTLYGGLEVVRPGGGHQTRSLRLITATGKEYNMRALKKSAVQFLETTTFEKGDGEAYFTNTIPEAVIFDFYTAAHPYGAFAIPQLAKAAKVFYTTPQLFYVPKQKALEKYSDDYGDQLYMIVERPTKDFDNRKNFGYPDDVESTDDLLEKLREDEKYTLDEAAYIRARIFDMLVGDWDRHSDQWRWAEVDAENGKKVFLPIPRDRDQVFANFDGSFLNLLRSLIGAVNQFGVYGEDIKDIRWFNEAGSKLDRALIKRSGKEVWLAEARFLQQAIDKQVVDEAFKQLPLEVQDTTLAEIKEKLLLRKDNLVNITERYFEEFIKFQMLTGTDKDDHFVITRMPQGNTRIEAYRIKDGEKGAMLFDRTFNSKQTKEIWLYGLDDDDIFEVKGKPQHPILIRIIGGQEKDTFIVENGKKIHLYDHRGRENIVKEKGGAHVRFTKFYEANLYNYQKKKTSTGSIALEVGYTPEFGAGLQLNYAKEHHEFILNPYSKKTAFSVGYQFDTQGLDIHFEKAYAAVISDFNFVASTRITSNQYTENFFGFGNETVNMENSTSRDFNRVPLSIYEAGIGVERTSHYGSYFKLKLDANTVAVVEDGTRFITSQHPELLDTREYFIQPNATYQYKNFDAAAFPSKGMLFAVEGGAIDDLGSSTLTGYTKASFAFYNALTTNKRWILKTAATTHITLGDEPRFYQQAQLGGSSGLRGYRDQRFTGNQSVLGSAEVGYNFKKLKTFFFPLSLHVFGGYDIGRVWVIDDPSNVWHDSYGGGFTLQWTEALQGSFSTFASDEDVRIGFGVTFQY